MAGEWTVPPPLRAATSVIPCFIHYFTDFYVAVMMMIFHTSESPHLYFVSASEALRVMNNTELKGKAMRVRWSKRNGSLWNTGIGKNLDPSIASSVAEENGKSKGVGIKSLGLVL
ncbi:hypothetical protein FNV43_RR10685 [Rhamnella rubrinervis]|uniref:Uncharacterized protein n=1 Tax=Rhamnella rubrinervis TaxID=2594499 RepID=A0A8K0H4J0_9ROSA|nr:hypothetical protein FNV43_RR10685 [Rhamnella rubrinervis]